MKTLWISAAAGAIAALGLGSAAPAQSSSQQQSKSTPKSWSYEIKDGKRVPKGDRAVNSDGSWREEIRQGKCITVKEKTSAGEYRESRRCN